MRKLYAIATALAIAFGANTGYAAPSANTRAAAEIEQYFNSMTTLEAAFTQTQSDKVGQPQKGTFKANRSKGQFVWQYITPVRQKVVGTGTAVYYVDQSARAGDGQVTQLPLDAGMGRLLRGGKLSLSAMKLQVASVKQNGALKTVMLTPTVGAGSVANQGLKSLEITLKTAPKTAPTLAAFSATDALGVTMRISLTEVKAGGVIPASTFAYTPPQLRTR